MTIKEKEKIINNNGYKILKYVNANEIHIIDEQGYKYKTTFSTFTRKRTPCRFYKNNIYQKDNILTLFKNYNMDYDLTSINNDKITYICNKHKNEGVQVKTIKDIQTLISKNTTRNSKTFSLCYSCSRENSGKAQRIDIEDIKFECNRLNLKYINHKYIENRLIINYICNNHKNKGIQSRSWCDLKNAKTGCVYCSKWKVDADDFRERLNKNNIDKFLNWIGKFNGIMNNTEFQCKICKNKWFASPNNILKGTGCPYCRESHGERKIRIFLEENNIGYYSQYRFPDCRDKRELPFDFYLPYHNLCIEFQGIQHFKSINFRHSGNYTDLKAQKRRDFIKKDYCKNNNIKLVEINYNEINDIENILEKTLIA